MNGLVAGAVGGLVYWHIEESGVPTDANCSYLASPWTDALATIGGAICAWEGNRIGSPIVAGFGAAVVAVHAMQYLHHKRGKR